MAKVGLIRVLLADDHAMVRQGLRSALQAYLNIEVVGEAGDGDEAVAVASKLQPTIVVMDINMSKMDGITATRLIKLQHPHIVVIGLTADLKDYQILILEDTPASAKSHAQLENSENLNPKDMSSVEESKEATERKSSSEN